LSQIKQSVSFDTRGTPPSQSATAAESLGTVTTITLGTAPERGKTHTVSLEEADCPPEFDRYFSGRRLESGGKRRTNGKTARGKPEEMRWGQVDDTVPRL